MSDPKTKQEAEYELQMARVWRLMADAASDGSDLQKTCAAEADRWEAARLRALLPTLGE